MPQASRKTVIIIAGPTAVGKTTVAIDVARHFKTEIISADSRQCFAEMRIGVARPSEAELEAVPHHLVASNTVSDEITAASFEKAALKITEQLFESHNVVIVTGGTGLYIKAYMEGLDEIPEIDRSIRERIVSVFSQRGIEWLQDELRLKDPMYVVQGEMQNPQRMMRALEVMEGTGRSIMAFRTPVARSRPFDVILVGLDLPREELYARINARVDQMVIAGLEDEARSLLPFRQLNALNTVGYSEWFEYFDGVTSRENAIELIKQHSRQYAKRQMTWFRRVDKVTWFSPGDVKGIVEFCERQLAMRAR